MDFLVTNFYYSHPLLLLLAASSSAPGLWSALGSCVQRTLCSSCQAWWCASFSSSPSRTDLEYTLPASSAISSTSRIFHHSGHGAPLRLLVRQGLHLRWACKVVLRNLEGSWVLNCFRASGRITGTGRALQLQPRLRLLGGRATCGHGGLHEILSTMSCV